MGEGEGEAEFWSKKQGNRIFDNLQDGNASITIYK